MSRRTSITVHALAVAIAGTLAFSPALAEKPSWAGDGKGKGNEQERGEQRGQDRDQRDGRPQQQERRNDRNERNDRAEHFGDSHRSAVREYYGSQIQSGRCPPGLAKKQNGCLPPGQARKWSVGRPLPRDVIYYDVPQPLVLQLGQPPRGYRYVRVSGDILMIAVGTAMVVDAIQDLGR